MSPLCNKKFEKLLFFMTDDFALYNFAKSDVYINSTPPLIHDKIVRPKLL